MGYSRFIDAYSAFVSEYAVWEEHLDNFETYKHLAQDAAADGQFQNAIMHLCSATESFRQIHLFVFDRFESNFRNNHLFECLRLAWYEAPEPPEYELTWKKICEAWIKDDFEGRAVTIATIDRMRQLIWDEPFRVQWAARPEEQEF